MVAALYISIGRPACYQGNAPFPDVARLTMPVEHRHDMTGQRQVSSAPARITQILLPPGGQPQPAHVPAWMRRHPLEGNDSFGRHECLHGAVPVLIAEPVLRVVT